MMSLTYLSTATLPFTAPQLDQLLSTTRPRNHAEGLTGLLLYADGHFIQTLEGADDAVDQAFLRIRRDARHRNVYVVLREEIDQRAFPDWSMGYEAINSDVATSLPGFNDYLEGKPLSVETKKRLGHAGIFHRVFRETMR